MKTGWKWFWGALAVILLVVVVVGYRGYREAQSYGFFRTPVFETERPELPALPKPAVLVFSKTNSFIHKEAIPAAQQMFETLADAEGWSVYLSDSGAVHNPEDLARFDVLVWNNVTGEVLLPDQRAAMRGWLESGGGFVGLHSAGDDSHESWPWYQDTVIRARFIGHPLDPQFQPAVLQVEQPADPILASLDGEWRRTDEWYSFAQSPRAPDLRVLLTIDESSYAPGSFFGTDLAMGQDHPVIWKHCPGQGRVFYSALGHTAESYAEPEYRDILVRAVKWAGKISGAAQPSAAARLSCED